jgi:nitrate reductase assembly molybdenum cofactor insertion protein NarJ
VSERIIRLTPLQARDLEVFMARPNGSLHLGESLVVEAVENGGLMVRVREKDRDLGTDPVSQEHNRRVAFGPRGNW